MAHIPRKTRPHGYEPSQRWRCCRCPADPRPRPGWPAPFRGAFSSYSLGACLLPYPLGEHEWIDIEAQKNLCVPKWEEKMKDEAFDGDDDDDDDGRMIEDGVR